MILTSKFKELLKKILSTQLFSLIFSRYFYFKLKNISTSKNTSKNIIIFNDYRCREDIEVYLKNSKLKIFTAPINLLELVEAIFFSKSMPYATYFLEKDTDLLKARSRKRIFLERTILFLKRKKIDCIVSPSVQYRLDQDWAFVCKKLKLNFICVHKEFTVMDEKVYKHQINRFKEQKLKYLGTKILMTNNLGKKLFTETNFCKESQINVIGSLRMDRILPVKENKKRNGDCVTLFSFGHLSGGIGFDDLPESIRHKYIKYHYFSNENYGFVKLFNNVHSIFAKCALKNPKKKFIIKIKNINDITWKTQIKETIENALKIKFSDIKNLSFSDKQAPDLIKLSEVVIGFNSTVLLEAIILNTKTIIPVFDEASKKLKEFVYFRKYFNLFKVAKSHKEFEKLLSSPFHFKMNKRKQNEMIEKFLGFSDGKSLDRFSNSL